MVLCARCCVTLVPWRHSSSSGCQISPCLPTVPGGCNTPPLIFILICSVSAAVKQLVPFAQAEGGYGDDHSL